MHPDLVQRTLDLAVEIQQIPAPTFHEQARGDFIRRKFEEQQLSDISMDSTGNVYARLPGRGEKSPVIVSAHLDTVFPEDTDLTVARNAERIQGPGIGDNSTGTAGLFGLLWKLRRTERELPGDIWLVANVGEEGLGDLCGMRAVVDRFAAEPAAYVILEGMALGQVYHRALGVQRYRITVQTAGGHSWVDFGQPSAVHELAALITRLAALPLPQQPRTSLNAGVIKGGTSVNTIAAEAWVELDLRSEEVGSLKRLVGQVEGLIREANRTNVRVSSELIGQRPAGHIDASHPLVEAARYSLQAQDVQPYLGIGSTDANIPLSRGLPAVCIGITSGGGAHTLDEFIYTRPVEKGLDQAALLVEEIFRRL